MTSEGPSEIAPRSPDANPADGAQAGKARKKRWGRRTVVLTLAVLLMLGIVGGAGGVYLYNKKTAIDRSTPTASVQQFLNAVFVEEDPNRVALFVCGDWDAATATSAAMALSVQGAKISWNTLRVSSQEGDAADVEARVRYEFPGDAAPSGQETWIFHLRQDGGWRVCGLERGSS